MQIFEMDRHKWSLCLLVIFEYFALRSSAEELTLSVNLKKPISVTNEKFLSLTIDPATLLNTGNALSTNFEKSTNMARALAPAYVRLGGPSINDRELESGRDSQDIENESKLAFSETEWILTHQWAQKAGLDVISCMAAEYSRDSEDAIEIVSFSDHMGYNTSWQLGYECQTRCDVSAGELGKRVADLRKTLNDFPRYAKSIVVGPDVVNYKSKREREYLEKYLTAAGSALSAITWHPDFAGVTLDDEGVSMHHDTLAADKDDLYKFLGPLIGKRPLWIAESKPEECQNFFLGALVWARRLGNAAKLKIEIVMRQPSDLTRPTPDYWVSLLHKNLVGPEAFDIQIQSSNKSHAHFYCQCTRASGWYERGSLTIFGINLTPKKVAASLKGVRLTTVHKYILLPGFDASNRMFAENVLLNDEPLGLINDTYVPDIKPVIINDPKGLRLNLPSGGIGFWVVPGAKIKSCMENREEKGEKVSWNGIQKRMAEDDKREGEKNNKENAVQQSIPRRETQKRRNLQNSLNNNVQRFKKHNQRREMKRLRKYLKRRLRDDDLKTRNNRGSSGSTHDRQEGERRASKRPRNIDEGFESQEDLRMKLKEFKDSLSESDDRGATGEGGKTAIENPDDKVVTEALSLISIIEDTLKTAKQNTDVEERMKLSASVESYLKSLYDLVTRNHLGESRDTSESEEIEDGAKRFKRELSNGMTEAPMGMKRESIVRKRSRIDDRASERKLKRREDIGKEIRPSVIDRKFSDSGENTFYGFFKTAPAAGFPEGDLFLDTGDSAQTGDYDYVKDEEEESGEPKDKLENRRLTVPEAKDGTEQEDIWLEEANDYQGYAPNEFFENIKMSNVGVQGNAKDRTELWEAENHEEDKADKSQDESEVEAGEREESSGNERIFQAFPGYRDEGKFPRISRMENYDLTKFPPRGSSVRPSIRIRQTPMARLLAPRSDKGRTADQRTRTLDHGVNQFFRGTDFPMGDQEGIQEGKRLRRKSNNLNTVFEQEMINEDDNNLKDCRCRVIRDFEGPSRFHYFHLKRHARDTREAGKYTENTSYREAPVEPIADDLSDLIAIDPNSYVGTEETDIGVTEVPIVANDKNLEMKLEITTERNWDERSNHDRYRGIDINIDNAETHYPEENTSARTPQHFNLDTSSVDHTSTRSIIEKRTDDTISNVSTPREEETFFRGHTGERKVEKTTVHTVEDTTEYSTSTSQSITSPVKENVTEKTIAVGPERAKVPEELSKAESSATTSEPTALSGKEIVEHTPESHDNDKATAESLEGRVGERFPVKFVTDTPDAMSANIEIQRLNDSTRNKKLTSRAASPSRLKKRLRGRGREGEKLREEFLEKVRSLLSTKDQSDDKKGNNRGIVGLPIRSLFSSDRNSERQSDRDEQIERLKSKLREKREQILKQYREEVRDIVDEINDEEKRNLRRREAWERIKESDGYRDMIDREKLAYILMYKPANYDSTKREERAEQKRYAPGAEIVRGLNVRERMVHPRYHRHFNDPMILRHSNPRSLKESVRLKDISENLAPRREDERGNGKPYYAIVENIKNPRLLQYREKQLNERRKNVQPSPITLPNLKGYILNLPQLKRYQDTNDNYKIIGQQEDEEEEEESNESSEDRKIYAIDPSTYRGGEPILKLHVDSEESPRDSLTRIPENLYRMVWNPFLNRLQSDVQTAQRAENSEKENPVGNAEENNGNIENVHNLGTTELHDLSKKYSKSELLRILMKSLGLQNMNQNGEELTEQNHALNNEGQNVSDSIADRKTEGTEAETSITDTQDVAQLPEQILEEEQNHFKPKSPEEIQTESHRIISVGNGDTFQTTDGNTEIRVAQEHTLPESLPEVNINGTAGTNSRVRRDTDSLPNFLLRTVPRQSKRIERQNIFPPKKESAGISNEDESKVFELINNNEKYMAVPIEDLHIRTPSIDSLVPKNFKDYIRLVEERGSDDSVISGEGVSLELDKVIAPPRLNNKYSPMKLYKDLVESVNSQGFRRAFQDYSDDSVSAVESLELEKSDERSDDFSLEFAEENRSYDDEPRNERNEGENSEESDERVDPKDVMVFDDPGILMLVPWRNRKFDRLRRHVKDQGRMDGNQNSDVVQSLQKLEGSTVPNVIASNTIDGIDELILKKNLSPKYSKKQSLAKDYIKKLKEDDIDADKNKRLPSFINGAIPKLENVLIDGIEKAQNLTESVEQLIDNFDEKYNETMKTDEQKNSVKPDSTNTTQNVFRSALTNVKKFFVFLGGFTRVLCG